MSVVVQLPHSFVFWLPVNKLLIDDNVKLQHVKLIEKMTCITVKHLKGRTVRYNLRSKKQPYSGPQNHTVCLLLDPLILEWF